VLRWRGHIWLPGEKHTVAIQAGGHPPRTLENHATRIHQDQVAQAPHDLTHQIDSALLAGKRKTQHALECRLRDAGETRALNALAQEEQEGRSRLHPAPQALVRQGDTRSLGLSIQKQLVAGAGVYLQPEAHRCGAHHTLHTAAYQQSGELFADGGQRQRILTHGARSESSKAARRSTE